MPGAVPPMREGPSAQAPSAATGRVAAPAARNPALGAPEPEAPAPDAPATPPRNLDPNLPPDVAAALAYDPNDPLADLESADALDRRAAGVTADGPVPRRACAAAGAPMRVWPRGGPPAIAAAGDGFVIAGYDRREATEQVYVVAWPSDGLPRPLGTVPIAAPFPRERVAPPGLCARDAAHAMLAVADGNGALMVSEVRMAGGGAGALAPVAAGVDVRFAPAVAYTGARALVAWTQGATPMRTHVAVLDGTSVLARHDVTPPGAGVAAPAFVAGASPPSLVAVDAHEGMSPILRVDFAADGTPRPAVTGVVVAQVASPPEVAAAMVGRYAWLGYTAVGSAATSAVGLVQLSPSAGAPAPLVRGTAYGRLHVAAAAGSEVTVFAADVPAATGKDPPHRIEVRIVDAEGAGPPHAVEAPGGASHVAIARADSGVVGVAYTTAAGVYVARVRCDDGGSVKGPTHGAKRKAK
jgi:hypothetical protein